MNALCTCMFYVCRCLFFLCTYQFDFLEKAVKIDTINAFVTRKRGAEKVLIAGLFSKLYL